MSRPALIFSILLASSSGLLIGCGTIPSRVVESRSIAQLYADAVNQSATDDESNSSDLEPEATFKQQGPRASRPERKEVPNPSRSTEPVAESDGTSHKDVATADEEESVDDSAEVETVSAEAAKGERTSVTSVEWISDAKEEDSPTKRKPESAAPRVRISTLSEDTNQDSRSQSDKKSRDAGKRVERSEKRRPVDRKLGAANDGDRDPIVERDKATTRYDADDRVGGRSKFSSNVLSTSGLSTSPDEDPSAETSAKKLGLDFETAFPSKERELSSSDARNGLITEFFEQTDVREAIEILATGANEPVVVDDSVGGVVTARIEDATFEQALENVLMPLGLIWAYRNGKYLVAPPDPSSPLFPFVSTIQRFEPQNYPPSQLLELLPNRLKRFTESSNERNLIVIDAPKFLNREIVEHLEALDQPVKQVVLEAIVCVTQPDSGFRFGIDWNHALNTDSADHLNLGLNGLSFAAAISQFGLENAFSDFAVTSTFVRLLAQEGYVTIRAAPRVMARDGEKASITISRETFFSLQPTTSNLLFRADVQQVEAGISLVLTPRIRGNMVSIELERAEVSEDIRSNESRPELVSNPYPIINRRRVSTRVDVADGATMVIGGLVQRQTVDRVSRVPVLGSLPAIGALFRSIEKQEQDAEVAIFISPRIISSTNSQVIDKSDE